MIKVTVLGSSSAMAAFGRHPSAQIVEHESDLTLIDCGEGTQFQLQRFKIKINKIKYILISHLHGDHFFGLIGLLSSMNLQGRTKSIHLYAQRDLSEIITTQLKYSETVLNFEIIFHPLGKTKNHLVLETKTIKIFGFPLDHRITCFGFRFEEKPGEFNILKNKLPGKIKVDEIKQLKAGRNISNEDGTIKYDYKDYTYQTGFPSSYAYCSDTRYSESILNEIKNVDLLYHEATFLHDLISRAEETFHTTAKEAGIIARKANVKKLTFFDKI